MAIIKLSSAKISARIGIDYVCNEEKTLGKLISGKNCMPESCYDEFEMVRNNFNKQGGRTYYHMIQSFAQDDDISPEKCHEIGMQMAEHCFPEFQVLVATHIDKKHLCDQAFLKPFLCPYPVQVTVLQSCVADRGIVFSAIRLYPESTVTCQQLINRLYVDGRSRGRSKKGNGLSLHSIKSIRVTLSVCLQKAVDVDLLAKNPCTKVKLPNGPKPEMKTLKKEELTVFLEETKKCDCYEFYYLELTTGMRLGEICALEWGDLDIENKTISVNKSVRREGSKIVINTPKTKSSIRTIKLCDECVRLLIKLKEKQLIKSKYIFPSPITGELRDTAAVTRKLHRIQDHAGLPRIRFHDLRHSFATLSLEQGIDIKTVSHMLGHTDAGFTMNTYMHVTDSMQESAANTMGTLLETSVNESKMVKFPA